MGDMVIVAYQPKPGRENDLLALIRNHVTELGKLGLATTEGRSPCALGTALSMRFLNGVTAG